MYEAQILKIYFETLETWFSSRFTWYFIYKWGNWQGIKLQNMQTAHAAQYPKKKKKSIKKLEEELNKHFSKEDIQMAKRYLKKCSTMLITREMQIKTIMQYYLISVRMVITKKSTNNKWWKWYRKKGALLHCWWECKLVQALWRRV